RRDFLKLTAAAGVVGVAAAPPSAAALATAVSDGTDDRATWCALASRLASPLLTALADRKLKATMPIESHPTSRDRPQYTYLEGLGRLLAGLAPWLELDDDGSTEGRERARLAGLARGAIDAGTDPQSPDFLNFSKGRQPVVDTAFLAQAMLRAPTALWQKLEPRVQQNVVRAFIASRVIQPGENNWKLF